MLEWSWHAWPAVGLGVAAGWMAAVGPDRLRAFRAEPRGNRGFRRHVTVGAWVSRARGWPLAVGLGVVGEQWAETAIAPAWSKFALGWVTSTSCR